MMLREASSWESLVVGVLVIAFLYVGASISSSPSEKFLQQIATTPSNNNTKLAKNSIYLGDVPLGIEQAGCATSNCHGQPVGESPSWKNAAIIFERHDPHAQAFNVLFTERSQRMIAQLESQSPTEFAVYLGVLEQRCLVCHASPLPIAPNPSTEVLDKALHPERPQDWKPPLLSANSPAGLASLSHGVSCEACHGPAGGWLESHLQQWFTEQPKIQFADGPQPSPGKGAAWILSDAATIHELFSLIPGYNPLELPVILAETCVQCHVGSAKPGGAVTHDLIAAGHPRLDFELTAWREKLPPHWAKSKSKSLPSDVWAQGQIQAFAAREKLAEHQYQRANSENSTSPWPEFAHLACGKCHQSLIAINKQQISPANSAVYVAEDEWLLCAMEPQAFNRSNLAQLLQSGDWQGPVTTATFREFRRYGIKHDVGKQLQKRYADIDSWEKLLAWAYAAQAVVRDEETLNSEAAKTKQLRTDLDQLWELILAVEPESRYGTTRLDFSAEGEAISEPLRKIRAAVETLANLFE